MDLRTLLELLYSASDRSRTVHATVRRVNRQARELEILRLRGLYRDPPPIPAEEGSWGKPSDRVEVETRLWWARPDWLRWETALVTDGESNVTIGVKHGDIFWTRFRNHDEVRTNEGRPTHGAMTTDEERLLDPSALLGAYRFTLGSPIVQLNRQAIAVEATRRPGADFHGFGLLAERVKLVVDEERGTLLRVAVVCEDDEISASEITDLAFDKPIAPELFNPPAARSGVFPPPDLCG